MIRYANDPRVEVFDKRYYPEFPSYAITGPTGMHIAHPDVDRPDLWVLSPISAPREVARDGDAYRAWNATLPRYLSADAAIAAVLGEPRSDRSR